MLYFWFVWFAIWRFKAFSFHCTKVLKWSEYKLSCLKKKKKNEPSPRHGPCCWNKSLNRSKTCLAVRWQTPNGILMTYLHIYGVRFIILILLFCVGWRCNCSRDRWISRSIFFISSLYLDLVPVSRSRAPSNCNHPSFNNSIHLCCRWSWHDRHAVITKHATASTRAHVHVYRTRAICMRMNQQLLKVHDLHMRMKLPWSWTRVRCEILMQWSSARVSDRKLEI